MPNNASISPIEYVHAPPAELIQFIKEKRHFLLIGHMEPDGDCLGSQLAMASVLKRLGKESTLMSPGPFKRTEIRDLEQFFTNRYPDLEYGDEEVGVMIFDCSTLDRIGELADGAIRYTVAVIDHHSSGHPFGDITYIDPKTAAVTLMILEVIESLGMTPTPEEAQLLLFGFGTDTGFFRHLEQNGSSAVFGAAKMVKAGASPKGVFAKMNGGKTLNSRKLLGVLLERTEHHFDGKILYTYETLKDQHTFGDDARDSDTLYQLLSGTEGVEGIVFLREEEPGRCSAGLRSGFDLNMGEIARNLGGGGHAKAAGLSFDGDLATLKELVFAEIKKAEPSW